MWGAIADSISLRLAILGTFFGLIVGWTAAKATYRALVEPDFGNFDGAEFAAVIVFMVCVVAGWGVGCVVGLSLEDKVTQHRSPRQ